MASYAMIKDGVILNVIVADNPTWVEEYVADQGCDEALDTSLLSDPVSPGYVFKGQQYVAPYLLTSSKASIAGDGVETSTITYTDNTASPPATIDGTINGQTVTIPLQSGVGSIDVTSANPGDTVTVVVNGFSTQIAVT